MPVVPSDPVLHFSRAFLHLGFLYLDLRHAIRTENGPHIIRHWKWWLPRFLGTGCKNYSLEAVNLTADFPRHLSYIVMNNHTVNMDGRLGRGKPTDQLIRALQPVSASQISVCRLAINNLPHAGS